MKFINNLTFLFLAVVLIAVVAGDEDEEGGGKGKKPSCFDKECMKKLMKESEGGKEGMFKDKKLDKTKATEIINQCGVEAYKADLTKIAEDNDGKQIGDVMKSEAVKALGCKLMCGGGKGKKGGGKGKKGGKDKKAEE